MTIIERLDKAFNRVTKWRVLLAGWQLGTRPKGEPEADAVRDHRELSILLRVELTAVTRILVEKGVVTLDELNTVFTEEADFLNAAFERRFPGVTAHDDGLRMDMAKMREAGTMHGWKP